MLHLEDLVPGTTMPYGPRRITRDEIIGFARRFDPQPMHVDEEAARHSLLGRLIASGWGTASINMRLIADAFVNNLASMGGPGVEEARWLRPVVADDVLTGTFSVVETRASASKPDRGFARFRCELANAAGETVFTQVFTVMILRRGVDPAGFAGMMPPRGPATSDPVPADPPRPLPFLEDLEIGRTENLGHHTFAAEEIVEFAREYDPQGIHIDPERARQTLFGGIIASGWHTGSVWMRKMVEARMRGWKAAEEAGLPHAALGPSPGFRNLRWLKPVYPGDTISYTGTPIEARPMNSRPGWGMTRHFNTGTNQLGERVFELEGAVIWQMKPR